MLKSILVSLVALAVIGAIYVYAAYYQSELTRSELPEYISDTSKFVSLPDGAEVHYRDEGNPDGPAIYMFHGGLGSLHNWESWVDELGDDFRLVSLDFPAHGLTGRIPSDIYMRSVMVETARQLAEHIGLQQFSIAGNSMGGGIALQYALQYPEKVQSLILIGSEGIPNSDEGYDASQFTDEKPLAPDDPGFTKVSFLEDVMTRFYPSSAIKDVLTAIVGNKELLTNAFVERYGRIIRHEGNRYANTLMFRQLTELLANPRDLEPRLKEITVPVLYLHGAEDRTVPEKIARRFVAFLPNSELQIYEGVGHMAMIEKPKETAADVRAFLMGNGTK